MQSLLKIEFDAKIEVHLHQHGDVAGHGELLKKLEAIMATLDQVLAKVTQESTDIDSLNTLMAGIKQQLADVLAGTVIPPAVQAKIDAIFSTVEANDQKVVDALAANVPPTP